ncbi:MAG: DUF2281 domain-containing protein [Anaerolineales bacterium]
MEKSEDIQEILNALPPELQKEVKDFARFLFEKKVKKRNNKLRQDWAGGLRDFRTQYTSLELQKNALEWRDN